MSLTGKASVFFERARQNGIRTLHEAIDCLEHRFDNSMLAQEALLQLRIAKQVDREDSRTFADRLFELAYQAYPQGSNDAIEREVLSSFILGLRDDSARHFLSLRNVKTVREAISGLRYLHYANEVSHLKQHPKVRQISLPIPSQGNPVDFFQDVESFTSDIETNDPLVRQLKGKGGNLVYSQQGNALDRLQRTLDQQREAFGGLTKTIEASTKQQCDALKSLTHTLSKFSIRKTDGQGQTSRPPLTPKESLQCFNCGSKDHFVKDCPKQLRPRVRQALASDEYAEAPGELEEGQELADENSFLDLDFQLSQGP